ncbi:MAG: FAD-dependent oxidoreductase [Patescibacteria group bacterium]
MSHIYDLAIIGGGPGGAAAGVYASRKRLKTVFITKDWLGQSNVSEKIENWVGTIAISGLELSTSLEKHVKAYAEGIIDFKEGELCTQIQKSDTEDAVFTISTDKGSYQAKTILITSGSSRRTLDVPGAKEYDNKGLTYCATCDGPLFADQDVVVVGGGNAGFESAAQLLAYCKSVTLLSRSEFKADPGTVEKVLSNPKMRAITNALPKEVRGEKFVTSFTYTDTASGTDITLPVTGVFVEVGSIPNSSFVKDIVKLDQYNRIPVDPRTQMTSTPGIWAAGDVTDGLYHQNNIAAGDAVKALEDIYLYIHAK